MKVSIMSRSQAETFEFLPNSQVVSITNKGGKRANITGTKDVLYLFFNDDDKDFSEDQAILILSFINSRRLYVHCDSGISRSAGVAAFLEEVGWQWVKLDGKLWTLEGWIERYIPNQHVKNTLLKIYE